MTTNDARRGDHWVSEGGGAHAHTVGAHGWGPWDSLGKARGRWGSGLLRGLWAERRSDPECFHPQTGESPCEVMDVLISSHFRMKT